MNLTSYTHRFFILGSLILVLSSCQYLPDAISGASKSMTANGNSLFHQTKEYALSEGILTIAGEIENPGEVSTSDFYKREVVIKETLFMPDSGMVFSGAYRYKGYSLFDLLHPRIVAKKNAEQFRPQVDIYVIIENEKGDEVAFSWSEIFHTNTPHQILIATEMAQIEPHRKEVDYPKAERWKIVAANDLYGFRNLENPTRITVKSFDKKEYTINRDLSPLASESINVVVNNRNVLDILPDTNSRQHQTYYSCFYGMGMGYHPAAYFTGPRLSDKLSGVINPFSPEWIQKGLVCFAGADGYRVIYSFSELFNRVDQVTPILAISGDLNDWSYYRIFSPSEFYADRSAKALAEIYLFND
jgi:hypothetical protein